MKNNMLKMFGGLLALGVMGQAHAQIISDDVCRNGLPQPVCGTGIDEVEDACRYAQSYLDYVAPICETTVANINDIANNLVERGYVRVGEPKRASSNTNCPIGALQSTGCLNLVTQVYYSKRLNESVLLCAAEDPQATRIDIACGGGSGLNVAPLAFGRVVQATADGSNVNLTTTVTSYDLDGPLRSTSVSNRMDPSEIVDVPRQTTH